jgi:hypothetical protein
MGWLERKSPLHANTESSIKILFRPINLLASSTIDDWRQTLLVSDGRWRKHGTCVWPGKPHRPNTDHPIRSNHSNHRSDHESEAKEMTRACLASGTHHPIAIIWWKTRTWSKINKHETQLALWTAKAHGRWHLKGRSKVVKAEEESDTCMRQCNRVVWSVIKSGQKRIDICRQGNLQNNKPCSY